MGGMDYLDAMRPSDLYMVEVYGVGRADPGIHHRVHGAGGEDAAAAHLV